jgi:hypothetical protein
MAVSYQPNSDIAANISDNLCRWDGTCSPHYEVWFLTLNHQASQRGFWFRYVLESPTSSDLDSPHATLWAAAFNRRLPEHSFGLKRSYPVGRFAFDGRVDSILSIGDSFFSFPSCRAVGRLDDGDHSIEWDLSYVPCDSTYHHIPRAVIRLAKPASFVCSPNLDTRFSGRIVVDGEEIRVDREPGCQSHLWGRKHVDDWVWVHSNAFEKHPGTVFEGLAARARRGGRSLPPVQSLYLRHRGEEHRFVRLRLAEQWRRHMGMGFWSFSAMNTRFYIEGAAQCRLRDMLQAEYADPDGDRLYCINSEVANLKIRLFRRVHGVRWRHLETIKSYATAHLEHASRAIDSEVRMVFGA